MTKEHYGIGALSRATGVKIETIRYYERQELLTNPPRTEGGHRCYGQDHLKRLLFIRRSRQLGFSMEEIRELLVMVDGNSYTCGQIKAITVEHAKSIRTKITDLEKMESTLLKISAHCKGGKIPDCPIVEALSDLQR